MWRIHPAGDHKSLEKVDNPTILTVWKRSSMSFQGTDGFTVFDTHGRLVFRVDNYSRNTRWIGAGDLLLMDGLGNALLTLKPQMVMGIQQQWVAYSGEDDGRQRIFSMRRRRRRKEEAEVLMGCSDSKYQIPDFTIEGSFKRRNCNIKNSSGRMVAKIVRKRVNSTVLLADDVFTLLLQPGFDAYLIMAFVIVLDRISSHPFRPLLCS